MGQFSVRGVEPWILKRILTNLNGFETAAEISAGVRNNPLSGLGGYDIGTKVAQRIIDRRSEFSSNQFTSIGQLKAIPGLGEDKFQDLVYSFGVSAADLFRNEMYEKVIGHNWNLTFHRERFEDQDEFLSLVDDRSALREWMIYSISELAEQRTGNSHVFEQVTAGVASSSIQEYTSGHVASYALALWFYRFDQDNWFQFETVREVAELYLDYFKNPMERTELRMFYGFNNQGLLAQPLTVSGLPVVVNYAERAITIWSAELID